MGARLAADGRSAGRRARPSTTCTRSSPIPASRSDIVGTAEYGERFATIVARGSVYGTQFHPEKSSRDGLTLLAGFARLAHSREDESGVRMILLPAIDILDGKAVRLARGDFSQRTDYDADPLDAAKRWVDDGARALHVVDLDGARTGTPANVGSHRSGSRRR